MNKFRLSAFKMKKLTALISVALATGVAYAEEMTITSRPGNLTGHETVSVSSGDILIYSIPGIFSGSGGVFNNSYLPFNLTIDVEQGGLVRFQDNQASSSGGAINFQGLGGSNPVSVLTVNNAEFIGNKAGAGGGGAIYAVGNSISHIRNTLFSGNSADIGSSGIGGAVYVANISTVMNLTDAVFVNNTAKTSGGAIGTYGTININATKDLTYSGNTAAGKSSFIHLLGSNGNVNFNVSSGATLKIDDAFSNASIVSSTVTKHGDGTLSLYGDSSTFTRPFEIYAGTLDIGHENALGDASSTNRITFLGNAALSNNSSTALDIKQSIDISLGSTATIKGVSDLTMSGRISNAGALKKSGTNTVYLIANNFYSGGTTVEQGTLVLGKNTTTGSVQGNITVETDGKIAFDRQDNYSYLGVISGDGIVEKRGLSTLTLLGNNIYTGGTIVKAGTLVGNSNSIRGDIANQGVVNFNQITAGTHTGDISGTGELIKTGTGNLTLVGNNSYTGGTQINGGKLIGDTSSLQGVITNDSTIEFNQNNDGIFTGALTGAGALLKNGTGAVILDNHTQADTLSLNAGALIVGDSKTLTLTSGATLNGNVILGVSAFNSPAVVADSINLLSTSNTLDITGYSPLSDQTEYTLITTNAGIIGDFNYTISGQSLSAHVDLDHFLIGAAKKDSTGKNIIANVNLVWNNVDNSSAHGTFNILDNHSFDVGVPLEDKSGSALGFGWDGVTLTKVGGGTLILDKINTYTGLTDIQQGKVTVGSTAAHNTATITGDVDVHNGAILGGHGQILGSTNLQSGSTIAPGSSIGTLTVGNITFAPGSTYEFEAHEDGRADKIESTAIATLNGGIVHVLAAGNIWKTTDIYTILNATNGVNGTYDALTSNLVFLDGELSYDANNVYLKFKRNSTDMGGLDGTYNQNSTGKGIESLEPGNKIYDYVVSMDRQGALNAFDNLSGEIHASARSALLTNSRYVRDGINQRLKHDSPEPDNYLWSHAWGHDGSIKNDGNAERISNKGGGILIGTDIPINESTQLGIAAGYEQTRVDANSTRKSSADIDAYHVMLYGKTKAGSIDFRGGIGYANLNIDTKRSITVTGLEGENKGSYNGHQMQAFIEGSYTHVLNEQAQLTPYINLSHAQVKINSFHEKGGITALNGHSGSNNLTTATAGVRGQMQVGAKGQHRLHADLGWQATFGDRVPDAYMSFDGGAPYHIKGTDLGSGNALIGFGADLELRPNINLSVGYEGEYGSGIRSNAVKARFVWKF